MKLRNLLLLVVSLVCVSTLAPVQAQDAPVTVRYMYPGAVPADIDQVEAAMNDLLIQRINVQIDLQPLDWGQFEERATLMLASGEECDIVFTAPWTNNYQARAQQGAYLPLDDLLAQHAPQTLASLPDFLWDAVRVNGSIYAVINQQVFTTSPGFVIDAASAEAFGLDVSAIDSLDDIEPFLDAQVAEGKIPFYTDDVNLYYMTYAAFGGYDALALGQFLAVRADDETRTVTNFATTPEFAELVNIARRWNLAGYIHPEPPPVDTVFAQFINKEFSVTVDTLAEITEANYLQLYDWEVKTAFLVEPFLATGGTIATLNAVCATSPNPEAAVQVLELLNTDPEVFNLIANGIEGVHWNWVDQENLVIARTEAGINNYNPGTSWMFGNTFIGYHANPALVGSHEVVQAQNLNALPSVALGFSVNTEPINTEIAQVSAVIDELGGPLVYGMVDPETGIPELIQRMDEAGMQVIITEVQRQIDEWAASR